MRHLDQLLRKCRHDPKMGGNTETIMLPCTLVARLLNLASIAEDIASSESTIQEILWADAEAEAHLTKPAGPATEDGK